MIIDTSAIVAILFMERDGEYFENKIIDARSRRISVASLLEATMVVEDRGGKSPSYELDAYLLKAEIETVPVTLEQAEAARQAWRRFGKGNHPARLNFGDCFSYALAITSGEPLLFNGDDFAQTDVDRA